MSARPRKDARGPVPKTGAGSDEDSLVTSEDLFGDLVDTPAREHGSPDTPARKGPIRIQVSEPGKSPARRKPELPEDMASLLDAFDEAGPPVDPAPVSPVAPKPPPPPKPAATPPRRHSRTDPLPRVELPREGEALLDDLTGPDQPARRAPGSPAHPPVPPASPAPAGPAPKPAEDDRPRSRTSTKFQAAAPTEVEGSILDLGAVIEEALVPPSAPAAETEEQEGTAFGPYQLLERVSTGGMAEVFRAKRSGVEGFEKVVAVKRILPHLSDNKEFVDMFVAEAKLVASLSHPHIVQIFDLGKLDASYYIAMEFVHGRDLRSIQKRAAERNLNIPMDLSALIVSRVCSALEYAHRKKDDTGQPLRIVHRDISPQNILISFEGEAKLTDFGIAKAAAKASTTDKGALRGKLLYMSPEQAWGQPMDNRSDLFSLGVVFYELLSGQKPFMQDGQTGVLEIVRQCRIIPLRTANSWVPQELERVVARALERDPDDRYQTAAEMEKELERFLHERQPPTSAELAHFLELIFDPEERGDLEGSEDDGGAKRPLELDFDTNPRTEDEPTAPGLPRDPNSIRNFLNKFGIK